MDCWLKEGQEDRQQILALRILLRGYKLCISPLLGCSCRFYPSCSEYAVEAIERYGFVHGALKALGRIVRCNPWCEGGFDPVVRESSPANCCLKVLPKHHS